MITNIQHSHIGVHTDVGMGENALNVDFALAGRYSRASGELLRANVQDSLF